MPLPLLAWAGIAALGGLGLAGHSCANDTQKEAEEIAERAKDTYNSAKNSLEASIRLTESSLASLGRAKKKVFDEQVKPFMRYFERIEYIPNKNFPGMDELKNFAMTPEKMIQLQKLSSIYDSGTLAAGVTGATTGAFMALAANGSLSTVGSSLLTGSLGGALTGISGALSLSTVGLIAAPVMFFTAFSANDRADENKEKARAMLAEAENKAERMRTDETLCSAIGERAGMFEDVLTGLNTMFAPCVDKLGNMVYSKTIYDPGRKIQAYELNDNQIKLCAVTGALAMAVKSVLDTPILSRSNTLNHEVDSKLYKLNAALPEFVSSYRMLNA